MPSYDLFISHAWKYDERYQGIVRLLNSVPGFTWRDYSFPKSYPAVDPGTEIGKITLRRILKENVRQCSCFVLVAGMFVNHREWVKAEVAFAKEYGKPVVGVRRRGQERTPQDVVDLADVMVNWNSTSLVDGIKTAVRGY